MRAFWPILFLLAVPQISAAKTWIVLRDGSGDFTTIQPAVDVAAPGDTVFIGPGRYDEKSLIGVEPWQQLARICIKQSDITIIGSGAEQTIVGPETWDPELDEDRGIYTSDFYGASSVEVVGIGFENMMLGVTAENSPDGFVDSLIIRDCTFRKCGTGVYNKGRYLLVANSLFQDLTLGSHHILCIGVQSVDVESCEFEIEYMPHPSKTHLQIQSSVDCRISNCRIMGGSNGIIVSSTSRIWISKCDFVGQASVGVYLGGLLANISDSKFTEQKDALIQNGRSGIWEVVGSKFESVSSSTLSYHHLGGGYIRNCTLARGEEYVVIDVNDNLYNDHVPKTLDMTNNWWGTANPDSIEAWIYDSTDTPYRPYYFIDWEPFESEPLAEERKSLGDLKAMYR